MKRSTTILVLLSFLAPLLHAAKPQFGAMAVICSVSFTAKTQVGEMPCHVAVCHLESEFGTGAELYVVTAYDREYSPRVVRTFEVAHSPVIEKMDDRITVLFTAGANTTRVAEFSVAKGLIEFLSQETIAWNDGGHYRTSASFPRYAHLLSKRKKPNQSPEPTSGLAPGRGSP